MRKMAVGLLVTVALLLAMTGGVAWAQGADPLGLISTGALLPYFNTGSGNLTFLLLATPTGDNSSPAGTSHLFFYNAACTRQESIFTPQTENDSDAIVLNGKTNLTEGAVLISGTTVGTNQIPLIGSIHARGVWLDVTADHGRLLDPAAASVLSLDNREGPVGEGLRGPVTAPMPSTWSPLNTASTILFAPPDNGVSFFDRVIFSCPVGTVVNTLAFDMDALVKLGALNSGAGAAYDSPWRDFDGNGVDDALPSSVSLQAVVFDDDETPLVDWTTTCTCVKSPTRLSALNPVYATSNTYTEIRSTVGDATFPRHMGYMNIEIHIGANNLDLFGRLHSGPAETLGSDAGIFVNR